MGRKPDIPHFVGCKPVQTRRLAGRVPSTMAITNIDNQIPKSRHRGWSTHLASRRYRLAQPNRTSSRNFVTPGGIGTHTMHPPRKRNHCDSNIRHGNHTQFDTRGPAQRSAPTRNASTGTSSSSGMRSLRQLTKVVNTKRVVVMPGDQPAATRVIAIRNRCTNIAGLNATSEKHRGIRHCRRR